MLAPERSRGALIVHFSRQSGEPHVLDVRGPLHVKTCSTKCAGMPSSQCAGATVYNQLNLRVAVMDSTWAVAFFVLPYPTLSPPWSSGNLENRYLVAEVVSSGEKITKLRCTAEKLA